MTIEITTKKLLQVWNKPAVRLNRIQKLPTVTLDQEETPIACCKVWKTSNACENSFIKKTYNCSKPKGCACDS